jgi:hypothetical protein
MTKPSLRDVCARLLALSLFCATTAHAQERLVRERAFGVSGSYESLAFGDGGLVQMGFAGLDTVRITSVQQRSMPVTASAALSSTWTVDITALYASGTVQYRESADNIQRSVRLSGVSDVRVRATGALVDNALFATVGLNLPTGRTALTSQEFSALRILAAPALGIASAPIGAGASGTLGLVYARVVGAWSLAAGASYEHRGEFQPVAAFTAGAPSAEFKPGGVVRTSLSGDRVLGAHRLFVAVTADRFASDRLTGVAAASADANASDLATVRLGPVVSADAQLQLAIPRFREVLAYTSIRWRSSYQRDGVTVPSSSGQYIDLGVRSTLALPRQASLMLAVDGRVHSGLGVDQGLPTSGVASAGATVALDVRRGSFSLQPYLRMQAGSLEQRNALVPGTQSFSGAAAGIALVTRF